MKQPVQVTPLEYRVRSTSHAKSASRKRCAQVMLSLRKALQLPVYSFYAVLF